MRFYFDRTGRYRGFSVGPLFWVAAAVIGAVLALALGYQLFMLAPIIALVALTTWLWRDEIRRRRGRRAEKDQTVDSSATSTSAR